MSVSFSKEKNDLDKGSNNSGKVSISPGEDLTVYSVGKLKDKLVDELKKSSELELDLSDAKKVDTAGFQLLVFIKREAEIAKKSVSLINLSNEAKSIFNLYGETP